MASAAWQSPEESHKIESIKGILQGLRDSLNGGKDAPSQLTSELLRICPPPCNSTVDMLLPDTDVEGSGICNGGQAEQGLGATLRELLNDDLRLGQLALRVAAPDHKEVQELLRLEVPTHFGSYGVHDIGGRADNFAATQSIKIVTPGSGDTGMVDASGFALASLPGVERDDDDLSFQVIDHDEAPLSELDRKVGTLEKAFEIRVDPNGRPIVLGKGGMGYVVTGAPMAGGAEQAIKVCSDPKHEPRMLREFEILSQLTSEGFPLATGKYRDAQGQLCYSMKLVRGDSYLSGFKALHEVAKDPRSTDKDTIEFIEKYLLVERPLEGFSQSDLNQIFKGLLDRLIDVATAVSTMHKKGFIHRDLKPDNVRIELDTRHAVILDFGLAKIQGHSDLSEDTQEFNLAESMHADLTRAGSVMGTLAYMSPEQASGNSDVHDKATDIYALGAMLYYLMTGKPAVSERDQHGKRRNPIEVLTQIRNGEIDSPARLPCIRADFADLEAICSKAMAKDPTKRYRSADEMIIDLRAWASGNPVKAYREVISGGTQTRYRFHHWTRQNPGVWNAARTAALGVLTVVGGGGYYSASQNNKASAVASLAENSLSGITKEIHEGLEQFLGSHTIETLPVEQLDVLVSDGVFDSFLEAKRKRLADEILLTGGKDLDYYARYSVVADIRSEAKKADAELEQIEGVYKRRITSRAEMRQELEDFRTEFAPIRDFLGNDFDNFMTDVSHERLDRALSRYLPVFKDSPMVQAPDQAPQLFFPECSIGVNEFVMRLEREELTGSERSDIKNSIATLLSYKVLNLQRTPATGYAPHVRPVLARCSEYLEDARRLKGGEPSVFDLILWERVASALKDPRGPELREKVNAVATHALSDARYAGNLSNQDLGILAKQLTEEYRYAEAKTLFDVMLAGAGTSGGGDSAISPPRYFAEYGKYYCFVNLAYRASDLGPSGAPDVDEYVNEAIYALQRALAHLSALPHTSADSRTRVASVYVGLAKLAIFKFELSEDPRHLRDMENAHASVRQAASGPRLTWLIGLNLNDVGRYEEAAVEFSSALNNAPYLENELRPLRARCYAFLGREEALLSDVRTILKNAQSTENASTVEPKDLAECALAMAVFIWVKGKGEQLPAATLSEYLNLTKELLSEVKRRCTSGFPYTLAQLYLQTEFFDVIKADDPGFWDDYVQSVSSGVTQRPGRR